MLELHESTCDFAIIFYQHAERYIHLTASLLKQGLLDRSRAIKNTHHELQLLHNQILHQLLPLERRLARFDGQIKAAEKNEIVLSNDFWLSLECIQADILIFRQFLTDFEICQNHLEHLF